MSVSPENQAPLGLEFNETGDRLTITTQEAADFLMQVADHARAIDEKKRPNLHIGTFDKDRLPYTLGPAATRGTKSALEKVAESADERMNPDIVSKAGYYALRLDEMLGNRDKGLASRIAKAAGLRNWRIF